MGGGGSNGGKGAGHPQDTEDGINGTTARAPKADVDEEGMINMDKKWRAPEASFSLLSVLWLSDTKKRIWGHLLSPRDEFITPPGLNLPLPVSARTGRTGMAWTPQQH